MAKYNNLDWAYKPDAETVEAQERFKARKRIKRKNRKRKRKMSRREQQCYLPGSIFYKTKAWRQLRRKVLNTYGYRCMCCGAVDVEIHVDHIVPRAKNPTLSLTFENLQVLCKDCNMEKLHYHSTDYREKAAEEEVDLQILRKLDYA